MTEISASAETALRVAYGTLLLAQLVWTLPHARRFFSAERYGGYADSGPVSDVIQHPAAVALWMALWLASACGILFGVWTLAAAAMNVVLCRYFFLATRWRSILRGMGAPGHMNYWLAALTFCLALSRAFDVHGILRHLTVVTFRVDFGLIMVSAGIYKLTAGYTRNEGMERGLVNPYWGYWSGLYAKLPPYDRTFALLNHLAYAIEIVGGVAMLFPATMLWGAAAIAASFVFIALNIRLTFLAEMMAACCLLFVNPGDVADRFLSRVIPAVPSVPASDGPGAWLAVAVAAVLAAYLAALPLAYIGMYLNFYGRRRLPGGLQRPLDGWTRTFGLIIWRVFTIDVVNFYVRIDREDAEGSGLRPYFRMRPYDVSRGLRYGHVAEFICLASIFTTLKYYPADRELFRRRLVRYALTVPHRPGERIRFTYVAILKTERYEHRTVREFVVDPSAADFTERAIDGSVDVRAAGAGSPVHAGYVPGSYAPPTTDQPLARASAAK
ncbi:MAG TPA: hypothetical protein VNJ51_14055 [Candidatus Dormibacteraeota bacterium]|nr:hypothetical protein [Candidatus Dormibacteraeota bacterium]